MAIYHFHIKIHTRSKGESAISIAAYHHNMKLYDNRLGLTVNPRIDKNVVHHELSVPVNAPLWVKYFEDTYKGNALVGVENFWNVVEARENRIDSQLMRDIDISLPVELTIDQNINLVRGYVAEQFVALGMIADWCICFDDNNPHAFIMLTMRELLEEGFGNKDISWCQRHLINLWREAWAKHANLFLKEYVGDDILIDHRSNKDRGIDVEPSKKHYRRKRSNKKKASLDIVKE